MFNSLHTYVGRRDRDSQALREVQMRRENYSPSTDLEKAIYDNRHSLNNYITRGEKVPTDNAVTMYLNARMNRHDVWIDYLNTCRANRDYLFNDIQVLSFVEEKLGKLTLTMIPDNIKRLTPDILIYDEKKGVIFIGDVSCTNSVRDADRRKFLKYEQVAKYFRANNLKVKHQNFIVDNRLNNISSKIREFENLSIILPIEGVKNRSIHYYTMAQKTMDDVVTNSENPSSLMSIIAMEDNVSSDEYDQIDLPIDINFPEIVLMEPLSEEMDIIMQIKRQTDLKVDGYYDNGIKETMEAFDEMMNRDNNKEYTEPKSTLKVVSNQYDIEQKTDHALVLDYLSDIVTSDDTSMMNYIQWLLPSSNQIKLMIDCKNKVIENSKSEGVYGPYQYNIPRSNSENIIISETIRHLSYGKNKKNAKKAPKSLDPGRYEEYYREVEDMINYYGDTSEKPSFIDDSWDSVTQFETENSETMKNIYDKVKLTCGAQLCNSMSNLYKRMCHLKTSLSTKDNIFIPANGSFISIIPKDHAPVTSAQSDFPMIFITRCKNGNNNNDRPKLGICNEYEYKLETDNYTYYISKLCRLSINKMSNWENSGHKLIAVSSYINSLNEQVSLKRIVGILTLMVIDVHQKTSELLDLLKYVAFMPFSDITRLSSLIRDKFDIMFKTRLDIWTLETLKTLIKELSDTEKIRARKPKLQLHNGLPIHESFGMKMELPSIYDIKVRHDKPEPYIEDISSIYTIRGKQFYGSQFMDKSITSTAKWEVDYMNEIKKYGNWVIDGKGQGDYPFESQFSFSYDAIIYAQALYDKRNPKSIGKVMKDLTNGFYNDYMIYNCSLRGCVKEPEDRAKPSDLHTTSMEACLSQYEKYKYDDNEATSNAFAYRMMRSYKKMEFSMSEKEQRGGGRPIATPTILTKASLMLLEKPESSIGKQCKNNVIVPGKNKLQEQCECYKAFVTQSSLEGFKKVYQLTEDQSKFSEMDNPRKFIPYINNNINLDSNVRRVQLKIVDMLIDRTHLVKRVPESISNTELAITLNEQRNGIVTKIGWPQGMCNFISTSIHMIADEWITYAYNKAYPSNKVKTSGLVHSDDSWVVIACDTVDDFKRFSTFRIFAKRLFCLKMNEKKLWGSSLIGELVSNYNINGNVHLCLAKTLANSFSGLTYQNWTIDVHTQVSVIQQCYRQGATIPVLIMVSSLLRHLMLSNYQVKGKQLELLSLLPIELGGYPDNSVFELGVNGVNCHYKNILEHIKTNPHSDIANIVLRCLRLSIDKISCIEQTDVCNMIKGHARTKISQEYILENEDDGSYRLDYENVQLPYRGDTFKCVNHLMPQSTKVKRTITRIRSLPFVSDGMEMIITRPKTLAEALGHVKGQTSTMLYKLASERYTQNARRLAVSQSLQASGKTVRLDGLKPMSINELLNTLLRMDNITRATVIQLDTSFIGSNPVPDICAAIVYNSEHTIGTTDKRKIINRLPDVDDNFKTLSPIKDILLYIVQKNMNTNCYTEYGSGKSPLQLLDTESELVKSRFESYFKSYKVKEACNLIMRLFMENMKTRLWMQPHLNQETITSFLEDLYGKTISSYSNYRVSSNINYTPGTQKDSNLVKTIYACCVLDTLYPQKFIIESIQGVSINDVISRIDFSRLTIEDFLKYSIIIKYIYGDSSMLERYDQCRLFSKKYIKPQVFENGRYVGGFKCLVKYGNTILEIEGSPGDVRMKVNNLNMNEILMGMMLFINDSFPTERYNHPTLWHRCEIWRTIFKTGNLFLTSYTQSSTHFTQSPNNTSIPIVRDERLRFDELFLTRGECEYVIEEHLRIVCKRVNGRKVRIGNVKQNLSCPLYKNVKLVDNEIDCIGNNDLLHTRVILNLTTRRPFANSKNDIILLLSKVRIINDSLLVHMYRNLLSRFSHDITPQDYMDMNKLEIIHDDIIYGMDTAAFEALHNETEADDLTHIETNIVLEEHEEINSMVKYNSIIKYLAQCYMINLTQKDRDVILYNLLDDGNIIKYVLEDLRSDDTEDNLEIMMENRNKTISIDTICFILATDLDLKEGWENINLKSVMKDNTLKDVPSSIYVILKNIKNDFNKAIFENDHENCRNELINML